eukprot:m.78159 g.78159  ORF g.78159 m.78159 type:complete len:150 (+) comp12523_c0_seq4:3070-3519(+)
MALSMLSNHAKNCCVVSTGFWLAGSTLGGKAEASACCFCMPSLTVPVVDAVATAMARAVSVLVLAKSVSRGAAERNERALSLSIAVHCIGVSGAAVLHFPTLVSIDHEHSILLQARERENGVGEGDVVGSQGRSERCLRGWQLWICDET